MGGSKRRSAIEAAVAAVDRRDRTAAELREWLAAREYEDEEIEGAVAELTGSGAIDDARYAELFASEKRELGGWGPERISAALAERGVDRAEIDRVCGVEDYEELVRRAEELLGRRGRGLETESDKASALGFLTRRGFDYEVAHDAIRAASG